MIYFTPTEVISTSDTITITLPRFSRTNDGTAKPSPTYDLSVLRVSPSTLFSGLWKEGTFYNRDYSYNISNFNDSVPYRDAYIQLKPLSSLTALTQVQVNISIENGLMAYCGFLGTYIVEFISLPLRPVYEKFKLYTSAYSGTFEFEQSGWMGTGCQNDKSCNANGICDWCNDKCICREGYGSPTDLIMAGKNIRKDCSERVCPAGKAIADIPKSSTKAHAMAECSNRGICDRSSGECKCFHPFTGFACERMACPNDCSGHGICASMFEISKTFSDNNPTYPVIYGSSAGLDSTAWDYDVIHGCLCDSSWPVGYGSGMKQVAEFFGADCSLRHCPSGDDPYTSIDETNCFNKTQTGNTQNLKGLTGNKCHVDCSNRGICDYSTGRCKCFEGHYGDACSQHYPQGKI